jgi:purine-binding chemotaxis protein CheW
MSAAPSGNVLFRCGAEMLALSMDVVREVLRMVAVAARPPRSPRYALGMIDYRGRLVPLIDLGAKLGLSPSRSEVDFVDGHVLLVDDAVGLVAYAVDEVHELVESPVEPVTDDHHSVGAFVSGMVRVSDDVLVPLIDPSMILTVRVRADFLAALAQLAGGNS